MKTSLVLLLILTSRSWAFQGLCSFSSGRASIQNGRQTKLLAVRESSTQLAVSVLETATTSAPTTVSNGEREISDIVSVPTVIPKKADEETTYRKGLITIGVITLLFASNSPALHMVYADTSASAIHPPVILLNAVCSVVAMICMLAAGPLLDRTIEKPSLLQAQPTEDDTKNTIPEPNILNAFFGQQGSITLQAGIELGLYKFLGTLVNIYGLSLTSAGHGAFLIQLTTLFVPTAQGIMGVPIPARIWTAIGLALAGVALLTQDGSSGASITGDVACVVAAVCYATYDLRLFHWGKRVDPLELITSKIVTQTVLSVATLALFAWQPSVDFFATASSLQETGEDPSRIWFVLVAAALWSGVAVNAVAPFLQVGGQQAVGPARAQILYASQPLWATALSWAVLGETVGPVGGWGGMAFLLAIFLAATADIPDPDCGEDICET